MLEQLKLALRARGDAGHPVKFWWRDDDATEPNAKLMELVRLAAGRAVSISLAAIVGRVTDDLAAALGPFDNVVVLAHGLHHANMITEGGGSSEFPDSDVPGGTARLAESFRLASEQFAGSFLPVFVPPWNSIGNLLLTPCLEAGFSGLSVYGEAMRRYGNGLARIDTHIDPHDWSRGGEMKPIEQIEAEILRAIDRSKDDVLGLLTHHRNDPIAARGFIEHLLDATQSVEGVSWTSSRALFGG